MWHTLGARGGTDARNGERCRKKEDRAQGALDIDEHLPCWESFLAAFRRNRMALFCCASRKYQPLPASALVATTSLTWLSTGAGTWDILLANGSAKYRVEIMDLRKDLAKPPGSSTSFVAVVRNVESSKPVPVFAIVPSYHCDGMVNSHDQLVVYAFRPVFPGQVHTACRRLQEYLPPGGLYKHSTFVHSSELLLGGGKLEHFVFKSSSQPTKATTLIACGSQLFGGAPSARMTAADDASTLVALLQNNEAGAQVLEHASTCESRDAVLQATAALGLSKGLRAPQYTA